MQIIKVQYGKTYSLGNYCSERIDLEASIDESKESVTDAVSQLREYCDQFHKKNNPHLYQDQYSTQPLVVNPPESIRIQQPPEEKISPEQQIENLIAEIENATAENILTFKLAAAQNVRTMGAFNKRMKQLNIQ